MSTTPPVVAYLRSLGAVRDRSAQVYDLALGGNLDHWTWNEKKLPQVVDFCAKLIERDFGTEYAKIPPHGRKNHFITPGRDRIEMLFSNPAFPKDPLQRASRLIDLYIVSVLLDAGAGPDWSYTEKEGGEVVWQGGRSEGLAVASWHMFLNGVFSSDKASPLQVDAAGLKALTVEKIAEHFQVDKSNPMAGLEGRCSLLIQLGSAIESRSDLCASGRPGDMLDYFQKSLRKDDNSSLSLEVFWTTLFELILPIWPPRTTLASYPDLALGDVWPCPSLDKALAASAKERTEGDGLVPFHKLTQWMCYSLIEPIENVAGWEVDKGRGQTGLPEYRNGGLLVDLELIAIKPETLGSNAYPNGKDAPPVLPPSHPAIVEWRALIIVTLDMLRDELNKKLGLGEKDGLALAQVLEAASWKGGREIAKAKRAGGGPPIDIISDGTVF